MNEKNLFYAWSLKMCDLQNNCLQNEENNVTNEIQKKENVGRFVDWTLTERKEMGVLMLNVLLC